MLLVVLFWLSGFMIFWAMIGYPIFMRILGKFFIKRKNLKDYSLEPTVTLMIVAHNEEQVIESKLKNVCEIDYPKEKLEILVTSDHSTDKTNEIVKKFIMLHPDRNIRLFEVKERKGKTNAQNEAQKTVSSEFLVMSDANAMLDKNCVKELMASFTSEDIVYVTGCLKYVNSLENCTANSENTYWSGEIELRDIESRIQTITAGNGALYACRNNVYFDFPPIRCHDASMPYHYAKLGKRCINDKNAIAFELAGQKNSDEFRRKVRMNRGILNVFKNTAGILNIFKYKWFTFFYFGHRTCRNLLWLNHVMLFVSSLLLCYTNLLFYKVILVIQLLFISIFIIGLKIKINNKVLRLISYYCMTITAQLFGVYNILTGRTQATWEKAESTRK